MNVRCGEYPVFLQNIFRGITLSGVEFNKALLILAMCTSSCAAYATNVQPCFVRSQAGAEYRPNEGHVSGMGSLEDCSKLVVKVGAVTVYYLDENGYSQNLIVSAGQKTTIPNASGAQGTFMNVGVDLARIHASAQSQAQPVGKFFSKSEDRGLPFGEVFIPASGLVWLLKGTQGNEMSYVIRSSSTGDVISGKGIAGQRNTISKKIFSPATTYTLRVTLGASVIEGSFTTADTEEEAEVTQVMKKIDTDPSLDDVGRKISRALVFEEHSFAYNRLITISEQ